MSIMMYEDVKLHSARRKGTLELVFFSNTCRDDHGFRVLVFVDNYTCECRALGIDTEVSGARGECLLDVIIA